MKNWKYINIGNALSFLSGAKESDLKNVEYSVRSNKSGEKKFKSRSEAVKYVDELVEKGHFNVHMMKHFDLNSMRYGIDVVPHAPSAIDNKKSCNESVYGPDGRINYPDKEIGEINILKRELEGLMRLAQRDKTTDYSKQISELQKEISDKKKKYALGNESIDKQEWSLFKGLKKDAEKEVGNADTVSEYNAEIQRLTKKAEQLRRMGQGRSAMEIEKQIEKLGKELRELGNKVGNAQYGSKEDIISHLDTDLYEIHQRLKQKDESPWRYLSELQKKGYDMGTLSRHNKDIGKIIEKLKTGNETKGESKFGKVMGEFQEGALKTPQGKTVTDPAQAKAIAYSEADKVDNAQWSRSYYKSKIDPSKWNKFESEFDKLNQRHIEEKTLAEQDGKRPDFERQQREAESVVRKYSLNNLKRARNSMAKNQQITLWKGNDSVLISEDGLVQYLESNQFETDRDKYDTQEKAVEELTKKGYRKK